jgi:hypothetical protein
MSESEFLATSESSLLTEYVTSQITYFGVAGAAVTLLYKFFPKYYIKLHRYSECRQLLEYATPKMLLRSLTEVAIEYAMCAVGHRNIGWVAKTFPSPGHALVGWTSVWPSLFFGGHWFLATTVNLEPNLARKLVNGAPAAVFAGSMFSGNDIGSALAPFAEFGTTNKQLTRPMKRTILDFVLCTAGRIAIAAASGYTTAKIQRGAWSRLGSVTGWFIVDVFILRAFLLPKILDAVAPYEVDGVKLEVPPLPAEGEPPVRPFQDEEEEAEARTELMGFTSEQMAHVNRFCWEVVISEHCRGSVKAMATKWLRYSQLLAEGTTNDGVTDLEDIGRVASVYENTDEQLDTHGVDDEHRTCAVCLVDFEKSEKIATLRKCHHTFHLSCIEQWWAQHNTCPVCRDEMLREQSSGSFAENPLADGEGTAEEQQQRRDQRQAERQAAQAAAAAAPVDPVKQVYDRLYKMAMKERMSRPEWEWGPLKFLFFSIGSEKGIHAVSELMPFDPEMQLQQSSLDIWHIIFVNLSFALPNWN